MALAVRWTIEAEDTFAEIIDYLENRWTEKEIAFLVRETHKVIDQIEMNPYQFKASHVKDVRKAFITKHTSLF
jgi:plasmid stabilization system protein ParE